MSVAPSRASVAISCSDASEADDDATDAAEELLGTSCWSQGLICARHTPRSRRRRAETLVGEGDEMWLCDESGVRETMEEGNHKE